MRQWVLILVPAAGLALCVACVRLSALSYHRGGRDLVSNFFRGRFDGDREWYGYYLSAADGQLGFESERICYGAPPAPPPANRWEAEDAVGLRTPTLRGWPFDGPIGFHWERWYSVSAAGSLHVTRVALPLWAGMIPGAALLLYPCFRPFLSRRKGKALKSGFPLIPTSPPLPAPAGDAPRVAPTSGNPGQDMAPGAH